MNSLKRIALVFLLISTSVPVLFSQNFLENRGQYGSKLGADAKFIYQAQHHTLLICENKLSLIKWSKDSCWRKDYVFNTKSTQIIPRKQKSFILHYYNSEVPDGITDIKSYSQLKLIFQDSSFMNLSVENNYIKIYQSGNFKKDLSEIQNEINFDSTISDYSKDKKTYNTLSNYSEIAWSTFLGGSSADIIRSINKDRNNNIIVAGSTESYDFPTTPGAFATTNKGNSDEIIAKFSNSGDFLWATYYGGSYIDYNGAICADLDNNIWVGGETRVGTFPCTDDAFQKFYGGGTADCSIIKLDPNGKRLFATMIGGDAYEAIADMKVDSKNGIWFTGRTFGDFPTTTNALYKNNQGSYDAILFKLNSNGQLEYSTHWGFEWDDISEGIAIDSYDNVYISGYTNSTQFRTTNHSAQKVNAGGYDAFLFKMNADYTASMTILFGGNNNDYGSNLTIDSKNNLYIGGYTNSSNLITNSNSYQTKLKGNTDAFLVKISPQGSILWNTYLGGSGNEGDIGIMDQCGDVECNSHDEVVIAARTNSSDFPVTSGALQTNFQGGSHDSFYSIFSPNGELVYSSYLGGSEADFLLDIVWDKNDDLVMAGHTKSSNFPITGNSFQNQIKGQDAFLLKFGNSKPVDEFSDVIYADKCRTHISVTVNNPAGLTYSVKKKVNCNIHLVSNTTTDISLDIEIINTDLWAYWDLEFLSSNGAKYSIIDSTISLASKNLWEFSTVPVTFNLVPVHSESTQILRVYNNNSTDQFLDSPFLVNNTEFSFDNSQLPKWVKAHDSIDLVVTFKPAYYFNPHYDTLAFDGPCYSNKIPIIGYVPYTDTTGKFTSEWLIDSCGLSKQLTVTSKNKFDYSVVSSENCNITEISKDSTRIVLNFTAKDPTKIAYWNLLFTDIYGNSFSVIDSLVVSDSYAYYTDESAIKFDTARSLTQHTYKLVIHNISGHTLTLNAPDLAINSLFTFDESQFPISILPYDSVVINLYYLPLYSHHLDTDTLTFHHGCDASKYIVTGYALPSAFFATIDQSDTCALNKVILLESVYDFHCQVIQAENCRFDTISVAPKKIVYSIIPFDPLKNSYWGIKSTDIYNNSRTFYDSIMASAQLAFKVNTKEICYDTVNSFGPFQKKLRLYNISDIPQTIGLPELKIGDSYSVDNSIFPLTIPAHDSIDITITYKPLSNYHADFDTLVFRHGCKTTDVSLFGYVKILPTFSSTNTLDSCGESNVFIMECDFEFDYKVLQAENCSIIEINKDKNKISLNIVSTNPAAKSYWIIEYKDKYGNCHKVCDSLGISARFTFRAAEHCITYDTVQTAQVYIKTLTLYNDADVSLVIYEPMLRFNTEFSLSSAEFPLTIAAHDNAKLNIYYAPLVSYRNDHDTLYVLTNCSQINIPLSGFAENTDYTVGTHCGTDVTMTSKPKGYSHNKVEVVPNPVIGSGSIRVDTEGKAKISINIYDESGRKACSLYSGEIDKTKTIGLDTADLSNGMYIAITNIDGKIMQTIFFINK